MSTEREPSRLLNGGFVRVVRGSDGYGGTLYDLQEYDSTLKDFRSRLFLNPSEISDLAKAVEALGEADDDDEEI